MNAPTLNTARLILEPLSLSHWEAYATMWADARTTAFIGGTPRDRNTSWTKFIAAAGLWPVCGFGYWSFIDRETGAFLGMGGLARFERGIEGLEGYPEAGWAIAPDGWGKGLATEAMAAVLNWADDALGASTIRCIINNGNDASFNVAAKLGFERLGEVDYGDEKTNLLERQGVRLP
jgi:RimJ/RimL family protein N-acetyltransferase